MAVQRRMLRQMVEDGAPAASATRAAQLLARRERSLFAKLRRAWAGFAAVSPYWRVPEAARGAI